MIVHFLQSGHSIQVSLSLLTNQSFLHLEIPALFQDTTLDEEQKIHCVQSPLSFFIIIDLHSGHFSSVNSTSALKLAQVISDFK